MFCFEVFFVFRWKDVQDEKRTVDISNQTEVRKFSTDMYRTTQKYLKRLKRLERIQIRNIS